MRNVMYVNSCLIYVIVIFWCVLVVFRWLFYVLYCFRIRVAEFGCFGLLLYEGGLGRP